ncbi:MAG: anaerobic nitric oxide reductase flavorubredoxin [Bacteroidia bacterium]|nr:anaerobic nitric oxide reductase flavorubredoxin [Bacteroidia bacterium]
MNIRIKDNIFWVGVNDGKLRMFHGNEYSTYHGTTYNSYLVRDEKTALIDTVWKPFAQAFVKNLAEEIDLKKINYFIVNHAEIDHSGAMPELMEQIPDIPIYCTEHGIKIIKGHHHKDWNFIPVRTGDKLDLGQGQLVFIQAPMLHWPDSMFCYYTKAAILFSNDAFGQHYCGNSVFNDEVNQDDLWDEAIKYYANILTPYSHLVSKKINEIAGFNLPLEMICPSHGVIWRNNPSQIVQKYAEWASDYQEDQVTILYDTMWNGTKLMAENIAKGINIADDNIRVKIFNASETDKNDLITEVFRSKLILVGSPTINKGIMYSIAGILEMIRGLSFNNKMAASFGCYGWHAECVNIIDDCLKKAGFGLISEGLKINWEPGVKEIEECINYGKSLVVKMI